MQFTRLKGSNKHSGLFHRHDPPPPNSTQTSILSDIAFGFDIQSSAGKTAKLKYRQMAINYGLILPPFCLCISQYVKLINKTLSFFFLELKILTSVPVNRSSAPNGCILSLIATFSIYTHDIRPFSPFRY